MKTTENTKTLEKEASNKASNEKDSFFDRHNLNWYFCAGANAGANAETNELRIGSCLSDFLDKKTENFIVKKIHSCDEKYWKLAETEDGRFILLNRNKVLK
jgi:hypothetical protein